MSLKDKLFAAGVVGCGGAGFPTHVKLSGNIQHLIINGAECEPLLRTDRYIMTNFARELVETAETLRAELGAEDCTFGLKKGYKSEIAALQKGELIIKDTTLAALGISGKSYKKITVTHLI